MKKKIIIVIGVILLILFLLLVLKLIKIIPNPFLNTNDLTCKRENFNYNEIIVFKFDKFAKNISLNKSLHLYFETKEEADEYYNSYAIDDNTCIRENDTTIILNIPNESGDNDSKESRTEILKLYTEYGFKCE